MRELSADELTAKRTSFFPSTHETLTHVPYVDWYSPDAIERGGRGRTIFDDPDPFTDFGAHRDAQRESDRHLIAHRERLTRRWTRGAELRELGLRPR